jgi:hypothetical protein
MLSFLYRLIRGFQREHGFPPNVVYLSPQHYRALRDNIPTLTHERIESFLRVHVVLEPDALHPHVAWQEPVHQRRTVGAD